MAWTLPPIITTGNPLTVAYVSDVVGDFTVLETQVGIYGQSGALYGSAPSVGTPEWLIQAGQVGVNPSSGNFAFVYPTAFPNGVLSLMMQASVNGQPDFVTVVGASCTNVTAVGQYWRSGSAYTGAAAVTYIAIGF